MELVFDVPERTVKVNSVPLKWDEIKSGSDVALWRSGLARSVAVYLRLQALIGKWEAGEWPTYKGAAETISDLMDENNRTAEFVTVAAEGVTRWLYGDYDSLKLSAEEKIELAQAWGAKVL